jgi:hypothetical protein
MLDGKQYFAHFPAEDPERDQTGLHSPRLLAMLRALEKELRASIPGRLETGVDADDTTP